MTISQLDHKAPLLVQQLVVHPDLAAVAQIANHVPMHCRLVPAPCLGVAGAEGQVEASVDLLVEKYLPCEPSYALVGANGELTHASRPIVGVDSPEQEILVLLSSGPGHPAMLEP